MNSSVQPNKSRENAKAGKYLTFILGNERYGTPIELVLEIFGIKPITLVPRCPPYMKGVINLRGRIIPILDLRSRFQMPEVPPTNKTCIIVVSVTSSNNKTDIGITVDTVLDVYEFGAEDLATIPENGIGEEGQFINGMGKHADGSVTILLDLNRLFSERDFVVASE
jgi:purine-binding chemotaxis protein CheW